MAPYHHQQGVGASSAPTAYVPIYSVQRDQPLLPPSQQHFQPPPGLRRSVQGYYTPYAGASNVGEWVSAHGVPVTSAGSGLWPNGGGVSQQKNIPFDSATANGALGNHGFSVAQAGIPDAGYDESGIPRVSYKDHVQQMMNFFGQPKSTVHDRPAEDAYDVEYYNLPQAFEGTNVKMRTIIIDFISQAELYPIALLFPLERNETSMSIMVNRAFLFWLYRVVAHVYVVCVSFVSGTS
jgi:hypothetical protein